MTRLFLLVISIFIFAAGFCQAQTPANSAVKKGVVISAVTAAKASPAYAEILLRRTERQSEIEELLINYTEEFPKVKEIKYELSLIQKDLDKIAAVSAAESGRLTLALGKLMVRKIEIETDLWNLQRQYNNDHPEVKRAKRKIEVFEKAIREIIP
jgi:uncharacterized protein involved in exopolysaccharide biosynthesis